MNNTNTTFSHNDNPVLEQRYKDKARNKSKLDPLKTIQGL